MSSSPRFNMLNTIDEQSNSSRPNELGKRPAPLRVMLLQSSLAHYRQGLIRELGKLSDLDLHIVADFISETPFVETMSLPPHVLKKFTKAPVRVLKGPKRIQLVWQPRAVQAFFCIKPDVAIALGSPYLISSWILVALGRALGVPVVLWTHGLLSEESGPKWWLRSLQFRLAKGLALYGERAQQLLIRKGIDPSKLHVIYNSLDVDEQSREYNSALAFDLSELRKEYSVEDADRVVIFTGRLQKIKCIDRLVLAIAALKTHGRNVHLLLIGEGELRDQLKLQVASLGVERQVHFLGAVHAESELAKYYRVSDLSVIPTRPGLTVMHSMIYGVPVLTTDRLEEQFPEAEAIIPGETGFLCDTDDGDRLAAALMDILFPYSPKGRMEERCREVIINTFTPERQARLLYEAALAARDSAHE